MLRPKPPAPAVKIPLARYWALLSVYLRGQRRLFVILVLVLLASIASTLVIPQITREFVDGAQQRAELSTLIWLAAGFLLAAILTQGLRIGATWLGELVAWTATNQLRVDLARHCLNLDMEFHKSRTPGEMIERLDEDVTMLARFFSQLVVMVAGNLILLVGIIALYLREDLWLGATFAIFSLVSLTLLNSVREIAMPFEVKRRQVLADLFGFLEERLSGTEDIRANGAVKYTINGLYRIQANLQVVWKEVQLRFWVLSTLSRAVTGVGYCLALVSSFVLFEADTITIGTAFLVVQYMHQLAMPLQQLSSQVEQLQGVGASIERITELLDEKSSQVPGTEVAQEKGSIAFEHVRFGYDANTPVLRDVSFKLEPGRVMGLLGRTGSGKSTIARLVFRLYDADAGTVRVCGQPVEELAADSLSSQVTMVTQDVQLFAASVRDNLTFFDDSIDDAALIEVLHRVELSHWFSRLSDGLDTRLESGGRSMSAGEAQLLAFARVFLKDPSVVILDEASSRLDPATEQKIENAVDKLLEDRAAIIIAHRLATVQRADDILILEDGLVGEYGDRIALLDDPNSKLAQLMKKGFEDVLV